MTEETVSHGGNGVNGDERRMRLFDWPPKAACRDVSDARYKPLVDRACGLYLRSSYITAVGVLCTPTIEQPQLLCP